MKLCMTLAVIVASCLVVTPGCVGVDATPEQFAQKMVALEKLAALADQHNWAGDVTVNWEGAGEVYQKAAFGLDSGVDLHAHFQCQKGNSKAETSKPEGTDPEGGPGEAD